MMRLVEVVPHDRSWRIQFAHESIAIAHTLGKNTIAVHHIGSTAIPGIYAKPIVDFLVEVREIAIVDPFNSAMQTLGYEAMGEFGIPGRRYFRKDINGVRTHHVHTFEIGSPQIDRHLNFRDYMIAHSEEAKRYSDLKRDLAKQFPTDIEGYMDGKDAFIKAIDQKAAVYFG